MGPNAQFNVNQLRVSVSPDRDTMGAAAANFVLETLEELIRETGSARVVFACAPSQNEFLAALVEKSKTRSLGWDKVEIFHMDEYAGLGPDHPQSFRKYLHDHLLRHIHPKAFHPLPGEATDLAAAAREYGAKLTAEPIDLICMGIGENGHVAFNDPPVADFADPLPVKVVELDSVCRNQQVNDGCFPSIDKVPTHALTITVPNFLQARVLSCVVPNARKAEAVRKTLNDQVGRECPGTLLREHPGARLFIDQDAASRLDFSKLQA